jgi:type IV pilus assembly protein PilF
MTKISKRLLAFLWILIVAPVAPTQAQVVVPESSYNTSSAVATDARTRARLHTELGSAYFQDGNVAVALEEVAIAIKIDPSYASAYSVRALIYATLREFSSADADFKKALGLAPGDPDVNNNYGWYLCQQDRARESITYFLNAIKNPLYSTPDMAYANAGTCALKAGDLEGARNYLFQALRMNGDGAPMAQLQLAKLNYLEGNLAEARNRLLDVLQQTQPSPEALWLGVRIERKLGNRTEEGSLAAQLRRLYPASSEYQEFLKGNYE